jgi:hypothetical protein
MNDTDSRATPLRRAQTMRWLRHIAPSVKLLYTSLMRQHPDRQSTEWRHRVQASYWRAAPTAHASKFHRFPRLSSRAHWT